MNLIRKQPENSGWIDLVIANILISEEGCTSLLQHPVPARHVTCYVLISCVTYSNSADTRGHHLTGSAHVLLYSGTVAQWHFPQKVIFKVFKFMSLVKVTNKGRVTLPTAIRKQIGLNIGDLVEAQVEGNKITLVPQTILDREIAESIEEIRQGKGFGPFSTAEDVIAALNRNSKKRRKIAKRG